MYKKFINISAPYNSIINIIPNNIRKERTTKNRKIISIDEIIRKNNVLPIIYLNPPKWIYTKPFRKNFRGTKKEIDGKKKCDNIKDKMNKLETFSKGTSSDVSGA